MRSEHKPLSLANHYYRERVWPRFVFPLYDFNAPEGSGWAGGGLYYESKLVYREIIIGIRGVIEGVTNFQHWEWGRHLAPPPEDPDTSLSIPFQHLSTIVHIRLSFQISFLI